MSILSKIREIIEGMDLSAPSRATCSPDQIELLRLHNQKIDDATYTGKPDPNMLERYCVLRAPVSRLTTLIDEDSLAPIRKKQARIDVTTNVAFLPYIAWAEVEPEPTVVNGNHRIAAFNYLCFMNTDIVCPSGHDERIAEWLSSDTKS